MKRRSQLLLLILALSFLFSSFALIPGVAVRETLSSDPGSHTFSGRRGTFYTANWNPDNYEVTIVTPDGTFPWDWISFVGERGAIALAGHNQVASTLAFSNTSALAGLQPGDIMRVKAWDTLNLAHLSKIGLVLGSGSDASRYWLANGVIQEYYLAPDFIGYKVLVGGRTVIVRLSNLVIGPRQVVGVVHVSLDDPTGVYLYFVSDLEPSDRYQQAVEFREDKNTLLSYDSAAQAIRGIGTGSISAYLYSSLPLLSWSANDLSFDDYLSTDQLDEQIRAGQSDARVAVRVAAASDQYFYIGNAVLTDPHRANPSLLQEPLRQQRMEILMNLPLMQAAYIPGFEFVSVLSNLFMTYLVNPGGNIHYTDKVFPYTADNLMILTEAPEILPGNLLNSYRDYLIMLSACQYTHPSQGSYWWRAEIDGNPPLPDWYAGNIPEIVFRSQHDSLIARYQYSDLFATAEYLMAFAAYHRLTGDTAFIQNNEPNLILALEALENYNNAYRADVGEDEFLFPHLKVPMGDLYYIEGIYPAESAMTIYAFEDASYLLELLGKDDLRLDLAAVVEEMRISFDDFFWVEAESYFLPRRDLRSSTGSGENYHDFWSHTIYPVLRGDIGKQHLPAMLDVLNSSRFIDQDNNFRWLSTDSENYRPDSEFLDGFVMEGGFFNGAPNIAPAIGYYQLGLPELGNQAVQELYFDIWTRMGPYETMRQWDNQPPGLYLEASIYIESLISTLWLIKEIMGLQVVGDQVTIAPVILGQFHLERLNITSKGKNAVITYGRNVEGCEYIDIISNTGLNITAPQTGICEPPPSPTSTPTPPVPTPTHPTPTSTQVIPAPTLTQVVPTPTPVKGPEESGEFNLFIPLITK